MLGNVEECNQHDQFIGDLIGVTVNKQIPKWLERYRHPLDQYRNHDKLNGGHITDT